MTGVQTCALPISAIETNGTHIRTEELFPYVDQLIMDCKLCDPVKHQKYTGGANEEIMKNIRKAAKEHPYFHVRVPLIGGVNNATEDLEAFVRFFKEINGDNVTFEVLSYHEFGKKKWEECGWKYRMTKDAYVDQELVKQFRQMIKDAGLKYKKT